MRSDQLEKPVHMLGFVLRRWSENVQIIVSMHSRATMQVFILETRLNKYPFQHAVRIGRSAFD